VEFDASRLAYLELADEIRSAYAKHGILIFRQMFDDAEIDNFIEKHQSQINLSENKSHSYLESRTSFENDTSITDLLCNEKLNAVFMMLYTLSVDVTRNSQEVVKLHTAEARLGSSLINWHRDVIVKQEGLPRYSVVSIALGDSEEGAGRISYIPGSHLWNVDFDAIPADVIKVDSSVGFAYYTKLIADMGIEPVQFNARKGDVLIWNGYIIHRGDEAINSDAQRHTLTGHFQVVPNILGRFS
jgi:ectoine hydroxylase-related dioxygenase (phytanoyl-CoA dioxygenase family)